MIISFLFTACSSKNTTQTGITHFAYQEVENGKWGIMSTEGEVIVPPTFQGMPTPVTDEMFFVLREDGTYELHNINEPEKIIDANYADVTNFSGGKSYVIRKGENISCIDKEGNVLYQLPENIVQVKKGSLTSNTLAVMNEDNQWGCMNTRNEMILPMKYFYTTPFIYANNEYAMIMEINGDTPNVYFISENGDKTPNINADNTNQTVLMIMGLTSPFDLDNNIMPYVSDGYIGLKDKKGDFIIPADGKYKMIMGTSCGCRIYRTERGAGVMDNSGKIIIDDKYNFIRDALLTNEKVFLANLNNQWGFLSIGEKQISSFKFDNIFPIEQNCSNFIALKDNESFLITKTGNIVSPKFYNFNIDCKLGINRTFYY